MAAVIEELDGDQTVESIRSLSADPAWTDIQPLQQTEPGAQPVVEVQYGGRETEALAYLYAVVRARETSERVLKLTEQVIRDNSANYTAWAWRWRCLQAGYGSKMEELKFMSWCTLMNPKNYQLWNHRRRVALELGSLDAAEELQFAADCLAADAKNYHVWAHRQVVVAAGGAWAAELAFCELHLQEDVRNNSAWAQRFFLLRACPALFGAKRSTGTSAAEGNTSKATSGPAPRYEEVVDGELAFVEAALRRAPTNGSAWSYLRGLLSLPGGQEALTSDARLSSLCIQVGGLHIPMLPKTHLELAEHAPGGNAYLSSPNPVTRHRTLEMEPICSHALALLADIYAACAHAAVSQQDHKTAEAAASRAATVWKELILVDPVRRGFWRHSSRQFMIGMA